MTTLTPDEARTELLPEPPETIYLLDMGDCWAWCGSKEPDNEDRRPVKYIRAERPATPAPAGWVMVPVEPTPEMNNAAYDADEVGWEEHMSSAEIDREIHKMFPRIYKAMLAAAPGAMCSAAPAVSINVEEPTQAMIDAGYRAFGECLSEVTDTRGWAEKAAHIYKAMRAADPGVSNPDGWKTIDKERQDMIDAIVSGADPMTKWSTKQGIKTPQHYLEFLQTSLKTTLQMQAEMEREAGKKNPELYDFIIGKNAAFTAVLATFRAVIAPAETVKEKR